MDVPATPESYAGQDRRRLGRHLAPESGGQLAILLVAFAAVTGARLTMVLGRGGDVAAVAAMAMAVELAVGATAAAVLWRSSGRANVVAVATALGVLAVEASGLPVAVGSRLVPAGGHPTLAVATALGAAAVATVLLARRTGRPPVDTPERRRRDQRVALGAGAAVTAGAWLVPVTITSPAMPGLLVAAVGIVAAAVPLGWAVTETAALAAGERGQAHDTEVRLTRLATATASERDALQERDHDVLSALVALEGGLRALRAIPDSAAGTATPPELELLDALAIELSTARSLLAPGDGPVAGGPVDLASLVRAQVHGEVVRGARIDLDAPTEPVWVDGPGERLAQVVRNLLDNARRHAPGATVRIEVRTEGDTACLRVRDDGPGIPSAERPRVLQRRGRGAAAASGGQGLGLFVVRRLVRAHGGDLILEDPDVGTSILVTVPGAGRLDSGGAQEVPA